MRLDLAAVPELTYEDRRALAIGTAVAAKLVADPDEAIAVARGNIERMRTVATNEHPWIDLWEVVLRLGPIYVAGLLVSKSQFARDLRQRLPFAGILSEEERMGAIRSVHR